MGILTVELGVPYTGWPVRAGSDYEFGIDLVSLQLRERLESWARDFNAHFSEDGWDSSMAQRVHAAEGVELKRLLQSELGSRYVVELNPMGSGL